MSGNNERIDRLNELLKNGVITKEEYKAEKEKIKNAPLSGSFSAGTSGSFSSFDAGSSGSFKADPADDIQFTKNAGSGQDQSAQAGTYAQTQPAMTFAPEKKPFYKKKRVIIPLILVICMILFGIFAVTAYVMFEVIEDAETLITETFDEDGEGGEFGDISAAQIKAQFDEAEDEIRQEADDIIEAFGEGDIDRKTAEQMMIDWHDLVMARTIPLYEGVNADSMKYYKGLEAAQDTLDDVDMFCNIVDFGIAVDDRYEEYFDDVLAMYDELAGEYANSLEEMEPSKSEDELDAIWSRFMDTWDEDYNLLR